MPLIDETANMFDKLQFEAMKRTAFLINQSRGSVVNESALAISMGFFNLPKEVTI